MKTIINYTIDTGIFVKFKDLSRDLRMNKENLQKQIEEKKTKLADMEAELNKPEVIINYWQPKNNDFYFHVRIDGNIDWNRYFSTGG